MPECMHMSEPGSMLLAAFPNQCSTQQEGNDKIYFLESLEREANFSSEGKVQHIFSTCSVSHRSSQDSGLLPWTESLPPFTANACLWQAEGPNAPLLLLDSTSFHLCKRETGGM